MIDLEATLREHLEQRASSIDVHPDIDAVREGEIVSLKATDSQSRRRLWLALAAAAILIGLLAAGALALNRERAMPSDQPREGGRRPLANGVIVVEDEQGPLVVADPDGKGRVSRAPVRVGEWSPDGSRLAYSAGTTIWVADTVTGSATDIGACTPAFGAHCSLAWSSDARTIATATPGGIRLYDAVSPSSEPIATLPVHGYPGDVNWASDDRLVFTVSSSNPDGSASTRIDTINIDGSNERPIAETRGAGPGIYYWSLDLSPDGSTLVWLDGANDSTNSSGQIVMKLMMMGVDDATPRVVRELGHCYCLGLAPAVTWSPDGKRLALVLVGATDPPGQHLDQGLDVGASGGLAVVDADGRNGKYLAAATGVPTWQPLPP